MEKDKKIVIVGDTAFAEIAYEYFTHDSPFQVVGFAVERDYLTKTMLFGLPVVPFEEMAAHFDPATHYFHAAIVYSQLNRLRARLVRQAKAMGFAPASYISSRAFVWPNVQLGEHCFIFEDNTVQPFVSLGDNLVLWSGNHIGHHSTVGDNCFISSQVVISGYCNIGDNCFLGVNTTLINNLTVGRDSWLGPACLVSQDLPEDTFLRDKPTEAAKIGAKRYLKIKE